MTRPAGRRLPLGLCVALLLGGCGDDGRAPRGGAEAGVPAGRADAIAADRRDAGAEDAAARAVDAAGRRTDGGRLVLPLVGPEIAAACARWAEAVCGRLAACQPQRLEGAFGTAAHCRATREASCRDELRAPGVAETPGARAACGEALAGQGCRDFYFARPLAACATPPGTLAAGARCLRSAQCGADLACRIEPDERCGVCAPVLAIGGDCAFWPAGCPRGTGCHGDRCLPPRQPGEGCRTGPAPCAPGLACAPSGCVEKDGDVGAACARVDVCDPTKGVFCNVEAGACAPLPPPAPIGARCAHTTDDGARVECGIDATCASPSGARDRTCVRRARPGEACDPPRGITCLPPSSCAGVCVRTEVVEEDVPFESLNCK